MRVLIGALALLTVLCGPASAYTCEQVREAIRTMPPSTIDAAKHTVSDETIRAACKCIPHHPKCRGYR